MHYEPILNFLIPSVGLTPGNQFTVSQSAARDPNKNYEPILELRAQNGTKLVQNYTPTSVLDLHHRAYMLLVPQNVTSRYLKTRTSTKFGVDDIK